MVTLPRAPLVLFALLFALAHAAAVSADESGPGAFELSSLVMVGSGEQSVQTALRVPGVGKPLGFLERCDLVEGEILLKESGAGGATLGSAAFSLSPGDVFVHRESMDGDQTATASLSALGTYLDIVVVIDERSLATCLEGAIDVLDLQDRPRRVGNKRKTLKAVDL